MRLIEILQHSMGLNQYGEGTKYRNHYVTGKGQDLDDCLDAVAKGYMIERTNKVDPSLIGHSRLFCVTKAGEAFISEHSLSRPVSPKIPARKLRATRKYAAYLRMKDVCGYSSFKDFLKNYTGNI